MAPTVDEALELVRRLEDALRRSGVDPTPIVVSKTEYPAQRLTPAAAVVYDTLVTCAAKLEAALEDAEILTELSMRGTRMRRSRVTLPILAAAFLTRLLEAIREGDRDAVRELGIPPDHPSVTELWNAPLRRQDAFRNGRARPEAIEALMFAADFAGRVLSTDRARALLKKARANLGAKDGFCPQLAAMVFGEAVQVVVATANNTPLSVLRKASEAWVQKDENLILWAQSTRLVTAEQKAWLRGLAGQAATQLAEGAKSSPRRRAPAADGRRSRGPSSRPLRRGGRSVRSS